MMHENPRPTHTAEIAETPVSYLQTDTFCDGCGYNLHGQVVSRDERLGILIVRCAECGKFLPAGHTTAAGSIWRNRLATAAVVLWVLVLIWFFGMLLFGMGGINLTYIDDAARAQRELVPYPDPGPGGPLDTGRHDEYVEMGRQHLRTEHIALSVAALFIGIATGGALVVFLWHLSRKVDYFLLLIPAAVGVVSYILWRINSPHDSSRWMIAPIALFALLEVIGMLAGIVIGRAVSRGVLRFLLPPRLRQQLAFLWHVDGKALPATQAHT